jgi:hypothetical protein
MLYSNSHSGRKPELIERRDLSSWIRAKFPSNSSVYVGMSEQSTPNEESSANADTRVEARLHAPELSCSTGRVADITGSGMRLIFSKGELPEIGDMQTYTFNDGEDTLDVQGCVKWVRKGSTFSRNSEAGIEFVKLDQGVRDCIVRLAVQGKIKEPRSSYVQIAPTDLYKVLGVTRYATEEQIAAAYNETRQRWGGNNAKNPQAAQKLDEIYKAYATLRDPKKRAQYDKRFVDQHDRAA